MGPLVRSQYRPPWNQGVARKCNPYFFDCVHRILAQAAQFLHTMTENPRERRPDDYQLLDFAFRRRAGLRRLRHTLRRAIRRDARRTPVSGTWCGAIAAVAYQAARIHLVANPDDKPDAETRGFRRDHRART